MLRVRSWLAIASIRRPARSATILLPKVNIAIERRGVAVSIEITEIGVHGEELEGPDLDPP